MSTNDTPKPSLWDIWLCPVWSTADGFGYGVEFTERVEMWWTVVCQN